MENDTGKIFIKWFISAMFLLTLLFCVWAMPITVWWYHLPNIDVLDLSKYLVIKTCNLIGMTFQFNIDVPSVLTAPGEKASVVVAYQYPVLLETLPNGWIYHVAFAWFITAVPASVCLAIAKLSQSGDKEEYKNQTRIRGAARGTARDLSNNFKKISSADIGIVIGDLRLPRNLETRHFLVLGTTGTGKSYLLMDMIKQFKQRSIKMILLDRKGEFYSAFGGGKDCLFNPYDKRHANWNLFNEFGLSRSFDHIPERLRDMADSLFSVSVNNHNAHFYHAAADVFCSSICYLAMEGKITNADITTFFASGGANIVKALKTLPSGLANGLSHLGEDGTDEHSGSILSTLTERCKDFAAFIGKDGDFAVQDWIRSGQGNLYISTAGANDQRFRSVTTMLLDIAGQEIKAMPESQTTRLIIVIDELASLPPLKTLSFLLNEGRSKGVSVILANQTFSKMREIYGETGAKNIFANANTKFIFRLPEPSDAKYLSDAIGEQEVVRMVKSHNETSRGFFDPTGNSKGTSTSEQIAREAIYLPAQIQNLEQRHAIAIIPDAPVAEIELPTLHFPSHQSPFEAVDTDEISAREIAATLAKKQEKHSQDSSDEDNFHF